MKKINDIVDGKNILFLSTKNRDYIRNQQEINLLKGKANSYEEIVFSDKSYIKRILKVYLSCCKGIWRRADIIFVGFAPQLVFPFLGIWMRKKTVVIDFFISMYDTFVCDRKKFKKSSWIAKLLHQIDEITLQRCHHIIVDTKTHGAYFSEEFHVSPEKLEVMYLEADLSVYDSSKYMEERDEEVLKVLYFGSILPLQGVEVILEAVRLLENQRNIVFTIIGPIKEKDNIETYSNVKFYRWLSQEQLAEQIARADLCLAGHFNAEIGKARRTIPGKAYIYEAMNKPMVLGENEANRELFQEDDRHFFVEMGNAAALAAKITSIKKKDRN